MKKINFNFLKKINKKVCLIVGGIVLVVIAVVIALMIVLGKNNEAKLRKELTNLGVTFYEGFYYDAVTKNNDSDFLASYKDIGIKVNLDNLSRSKGVDTEEVMDMFVNSKTKKACDKENTKVTIYPQDPYGKKDYKIEVKLACGFKNE